MFRNPAHLGAGATLALAILLPAVRPVFAQSAAEYVPGEVLVAFREDAGFFRKEAVLEDLGARVVASRPVLGYEKLELPAGRSVEATVRALESDPDVAWAEPNWIYHPAAIPMPQDPLLVDLPAASNQWGLFLTNLSSMWKAGGGGDPSVVIAIVDSGVDSFASPHADIAPNVRNGAGEGRDFIDGDFDPTDSGGGPGYGHGTAAAGIAAAIADTSGMVGMAYRSKLAFVRVLDCNLPGCTGTNDQIAQGIAWAADSGSADVINLSLAGPNYAQAMRNAILFAIGKDAIVVAASGNDSSSTLPYPANYPEIITVGANDSGGSVPTFSNSGANLDVVAPGVDVWAPDAGGTHAAVSGTSFAAPLVSGVAALLRARNPGITQLETKEWLKKHTIDTLDPARDGAGMVFYQTSADWGDHASFPPVVHKNSMWEWLGPHVTGEISDTDATDSDGTPNVDPGDAQAKDFGDDSIFPVNNGSPPFAPTRWAPGKAFDITMSVAGSDGPRYDGIPPKMLHLEQWIDWNSDGTFAASGPEHTIDDHLENPNTWGGSDMKSVVFPVPVHDEHILGNPLRIRTRLNYGGPVTPTIAAPFGEVEDDEIINFVEDFDVSFYTTTAAPYMDMGTWFLVPDPDPLFSNHGAWAMARAAHPKPFEECTGFVETLEIMKTPPMDWSEYTAAACTYVFSHESFPCGPVSIEMCRMELLLDGVPAFADPIVLGDGEVTVDLSMFTGTSATVEIQWIVDTDNQGHLIIDDIRIVAIDDDEAERITDLAVSRTAGSREIDVSFTAPYDNRTHLATKEGKASAYNFRYSNAPITSDLAFDEATPILPVESTSGALLRPGAPTSGQAFTFEAPSAYDDYYVAARTGDEVVMIGALSNVPSVTNRPTLSLTVVAPAGTTGVSPGDSATVAVSVNNTGNVTELIRLNAATLTQGWDSWFVEGGTVRGTDISVQVAGGGTAVVTVGALVPGGSGSGTIENLQLTATSTTDPTKTAAGTAVLQVQGVTDAPELDLPTVAALELAGPNPFRSATSWSFALPGRSHAQFVLFDVSGRRVRTLLNGPVDAGSHRVEWDGRTETGQEAPSGVYFLKAVAGDFARTQRVIRMR